MINFDLSKFTTEQLQDMHQELKQKITQMKTDMEAILMFSAIELELQSRSHNGNFKSYYS